MEGKWIDMCSKNRKTNIKARNLLNIMPIPKKLGWSFSVNDIENPLLAKLIFYFISGHVQVFPVCLIYGNKKALPYSDPQYNWKNVSYTRRTTNKGVQTTITTHHKHVDQATQTDDLEEPKIFTLPEVKNMFEKVKEIAELVCEKQTISPWKLNFPQSNLSSHCQNFQNSPVANEIFPEIESEPQPSTSKGRYFGIEETPNDLLLPFKEMERVTPASSDVEETDDVQYEKFRKETLIVMC